MTDSKSNTLRTKTLIGYSPRKNTAKETYQAMGFKCGLEIHQQLRTDKKLFCRCPAGLYQKKDDYNAELVRHMRPTLSELGEYDGTALMEFKTAKNIFYRIKDETACTYDFDDTPPFLLNRQALDIAVEAALLLKCSIVGELHITRKQYLDGSIPTGFQRTAIVGIEGEIPLKHKNVRIIQLSIEEDSCREVSDVGHDRIYTTDRLGMPLIETVTAPELLTPDEAEEAGQYLRYTNRSTNKVNTGIGAARQDVNVSVAGGTRVEIKGVQHIKWIPELTHNEAFRQKALLTIKETLHENFGEPKKWAAEKKDLTEKVQSPFLTVRRKAGDKIICVGLPGFNDLLSFFTSPGRVFADEIEDRLKVIACLEKPNMTHSENSLPIIGAEDREWIQNLFPEKAWILFWGPEDDIKVAVETIEERCMLAFEGVPNETRKALADGTTLFERVLPGPDRMYPDTDSAPIPIEDEYIDAIRDKLPVPVMERVKQLEKWNIPEDAHAFLLRRNLLPVLEKMIDEFDIHPVLAGTLLGHTLKRAEGKKRETCFVPDSKLFRCFEYVNKNGLNHNILKPLVEAYHKNADKSAEEMLFETGYVSTPKEELFAKIPELKEQFSRIRSSRQNGAETRWIMGQLRPLALGNMDLKTLRAAVEGGAL